MDRGLSPLPTDVFDVSGSRNSSNRQYNPSFYDQKTGSNFNNQVKDYSLSRKQLQAIFDVKNELQRQICRTGKGLVFNEILVL